MTGKTNNIRKFLVVLYYLLILGLPFSLETPISESNKIVLITEPVIAAICILASIYGLLNFKFLSFNRIDITILALLACYGISTVFSNYFSISVKYYITFGAYVVAGYFTPRLLQFTKKETKNIIAIFLIGIISFGIYCLVNIGFYGIYYQTSYKIGRPFIQHGHTNISVLFEPAMVLILGLLFLKKLDLKWKIVLAISLFICIAVIDYSYSRTSFVTGLATLFIASIFALTRLKNLNSKFVLIVIFGGLFLVQGIRYYHYSLHPEFTKNVYDPNNPSDYIGHSPFDRPLEITDWENNTSNKERTVRWNASLEMFKNHPITGIGVGTFPDFFLDEYFEKDKLEESTEVSYRYKNIHNIYLSLLVEGGIITAIVAFILFLFIGNRFCRMFYSLRNKRYSFTPLKFFLLLYLIIFAVHGVVQDFSGEVRIMIIFWGVIAFINNSTSMIKSSAKALEKGK